MCGSLPCCVSRRDELFEFFVRGIPGVKLIPYLYSLWADAEQCHGKKSGGCRAVSGITLRSVSAGIDGVVQAVSPQTCSVTAAIVCRL